MRIIFSKSSLYFQLFFDPNQGSAGFKIDNFVTIKSFPLKIRPSTAIATIHCLKKVSLILFIRASSYSVSSIGLVFRSVVDTYFDYLKSKRWISTTVQEILVVLSLVDGPLKLKFAAIRFVFLFVLVVKL